MKSNNDRNNIDILLGYHLNPSTCGVARFNTILAQKMKMQMRSVFDWDKISCLCPLISIKISEFSPNDIEALNSLLDQNAGQKAYRLFLHDFTSTAIELRLIDGAEVVYCGNSELVSQIQQFRSDLIEAWCPGALVEERRFNKAEISVFSFGMAHKVRSRYYEKLHDLLEKTGKSYCLYLSTALHDGTSFEGVFAAAYEELIRIFGEHIYFLGFLSDIAVYNYLKDTVFFAAFFDQGVRANNTSVNSAMQHGSVVITNLDDYSPKNYVHNNNMIDIKQCELIPTNVDVLAKISESALLTSRSMSWDSLVLNLAHVNKK